MNELEKKYLNDLYERRRENTALLSLKQSKVNLLKDEIEVLKLHVLNDNSIIDKIVFENELR